MHNYIINASIQIVPIVLDKHPYEWVDEAIAVIQVDQQPNQTVIDELKRIEQVTSVKLVCL